jgi:cytidine deaminase
MSEPASATDGAFDRDAARRLLRLAREARANAYAPYSDFPVGAALLASDGRVFAGVNVENASLGLTTCAERTAVVSAIAAGAPGFRAIAVAGPDDTLPCPPCGSCRQILYEANPDLTVVTVGEDGDPRVTPLRELIPFAFDGGAVRGPRRDRSS